MSRKKDITGERFSRLVAVKPFGKLYGKSAWLCKCDCGKDVIVSLSDLTTGKKKSCGCYRKENTAKAGKANKVHGMTNTRIWVIWNGMIQRCKNHPRYKNISVCKDWENFISFYNWSMENGYDDLLTIDRIDNDGDYCPENCRWTTYKVQENNRSNNVYIEIRGDKRTLSEWSDATGISSATLAFRMKSGWPLEDMFIQPNLNNAKIRRSKHEFE